MLTELHITFTERKTAQHALTELRKRYRTGFSNAEMSAELRAGNY
jgi:hypothetical protein